MAETHALRDGAPSTFHEGELAQQAEAGVVAQAARLAPVLRPLLTEQQRSFFPLLPFAIVGSIDPDGFPCASLLAAPPGFVHSPSPGSVRIDAAPLAGDPLQVNLQMGAALGVLGIQPHTRRRNRVNGRVIERDASGITIAVEQAFGNCPKHIQPRELVYGAREPGRVEVSRGLGAEQRAWLAAADTFFIASAHPEAAGSVSRAQGVDVSHRGGPPGFLQFTAPDELVIPDFRGNNLFNTLGNLRLDPRTGLLFVDWDSGDLLQVSATASIRAGVHPLAEPDGSGRVVSFRVLGTRLFPGAARLRSV